MSASQPLQWSGRTMTNQRMAEKLVAGAALDVRREGEEIARGWYRLRRFVEGVDYCDAQREVWIWSIGRALKTLGAIPVDDLYRPAGLIIPAGDVIASTGSDLYQNPQFECLFLR